MTGSSADESRPPGSSGPPGSVGPSGSPGSGVVWARRDRVGSAADLHALDLAAEGERAVWRLAVEGPAVVLGSTQPATDVDERLAARLGFAIARRRSGGGAVVLVPDEVLWCDLVVPAGPGGVAADVAAQFVAAGERWRSALVACGLAAPSLAVLPAGTRPHVLGRVVCFGSLGPGEVVVRPPPSGGAPPDGVPGPGTKLVGLSQRRTRAGVRIQGLVHRRLDAARTAGLLAPGLRRVGLDPDQVADRLAGSVAVVDVDEVALADALVRADVADPGTEPGR